MNNYLKLLPLIFSLLFPLKVLSNSISSSNNESEDLICLAENIYWEARNQSLEGKLAVAHVTINRVESKKFPNDVCSVVKQTKYYPSGQIDLHSCQFSWYCDGKSDNPKNLESWRDAKKIAEEFLKRKPMDITKGSLWYHNVEISPGWSKSLKRALIIGDHIFYKEKA